MTFFALTLTWAPSRAWTPTAVEPVPDWIAVTFRRVVVRDVAEETRTALPLSAVDQQTLSRNVAPSMKQALRPLEWTKRRSITAPGLPEVGPSMASAVPVSLLVM